MPLPLHEEATLPEPPEMQMFRLLGLGGGHVGEKRFVLKCGCNHVRGPNLGPRRGNGQRRSSRMILSVGADVRRLGPPARSPIRLLTSAPTIRLRFQPRWTYFTSNFGT